ncbi:MAG: cation:proton antiporter, partial [Acidimicrobiia bacterium]
MPNQQAGGVSTPQDTLEPAPAEGIEGRFGSSSKKRILKLYGLIAIGIVIVNFALRAGSGMSAPKGGGGETAREEGSHGAVDVHAIFWKLLLAIAVIILVSRLCGALFRRINQPQVMGEIVGGILLGPSLLGAVAPQVSEFLFAEQVMPFIDVLAQVGLVLFMFLIGVELDVRLIKGHGEAAAVVSHASIVGPFVTGVLLALGIFTTLGSAEGRFLPFALFLGASMSITAFPVLARILAERGLHKTRLGTVTITCAAVDDVTAWCMLAVVIAVAAATGIGGAFVTIALAIAFVAFMIAVVRPLLARIAKYHDENGELGGTILALIFVGLLLSALATDRIGIHAIFGAFLFGAIMPQHSKFIHELTIKLEDFSVIFLLPLFFAYSGLRTEIGQLGTDLRLWGFAVLIIAVAIIGKWGGSTLAARYVGLTWRESLAVGILMNCRGLTEL